MTNLTELRFPELQETLQRDGVSPSHALSIFKNHHLSEKRPLLGNASQWWERAQRTALTESRCTESADGWTRKFLLRLADDREIESVLMGFSGRHTGCLSTQVGCAMGCVFCATGQMGFKRHLGTDEIVAQAHFLNLKLRAEGETLRNIVMMGMGEPLHNFDATLRALDIISDTRGLNVAPSRITISTVGHVPGILKLAEIEKKYELSISLHGASDEERGALIPVNKRWPLAELLDAVRYYAERRQKRAWIAWTLIKNVNDSDNQARRLAALLKGLNAHLNIIPLNPTEGYSEQTPDPERIQRFHTIFRENSGLPSTIRQRRGIDVGAGCGQLAS